MNDYVHGRGRAPGHAAALRAIAPWGGWLVVGAAWLATHSACSRWSLVQRAVTVMRGESTEMSLEVSWPLASVFRTY